MLERLANLVNNPASASYKPNNLSRPSTTIKVCTPLIHYTISPMLYGPADSDTEEILFPRAGRAALVSPRYRASQRPDDASRYEFFYQTGIAEGPNTRPWQEGDMFKFITVLNTTPYEYFECHHLTVVSRDTHWQILGADSPLFNAEVTETITDSSAGEVKLGYRKFTNIQSGDDLPDVHWMEEFVDEELTEIKRPCINALGGGDISVGTKCLVEQEAGGLWTVVAVEC